MAEKWVGPMRPQSIEELDDGRLVVNESRRRLTIHEGDTDAVSVSIDLLRELLVSAGYEIEKETQ